MASDFPYCLDNKELAKEYYERGNRYYREGRYREAQEAFQKGLELLETEPSVPLSSSSEEIKPQQTTPPARVVFPVQPQKSTQYLIGEQDVLCISVWQNPDLNQEVIVGPDGRISFPLAGDIEAAGLTISQLDEALTTRLKEYIRYPEVSVTIRKFGGKKVIVLGEVKNPGIYSVTGARTILEAIALAGGFSDHAVASSVVLIRGGLQNPKAERVNLSEALKGDLRFNVALEPEDIIFVPKKFIADLSYFLTQLLGPLSEGFYIYSSFR